MIQLKNQIGLGSNLPRYQFKRSRWSGFVSQKKKKKDGPGLNITIQTSRIELKLSTNY